MKRFLIAINEARALAVTNLVGAWNELRLAANERESWVRLTPMGEFPVTVNENGGSRVVMQVIDREACDSMVANFKTLSIKVANFFRGAPFYEGHPDDRGWAAANPGIKAAAVGRIKELQTRADGLWGRVAWNSRGVALLDPEAPEYSGQSPHWGMDEVKGRADAYRPVVLWSAGLTNTPNIPENTVALNELGYGQPSPPSEKVEDEPENENNMKLTPENLKALGFAPDATPTPEEINAAIAKMYSEMSTAKAEKTTADNNLVAANSRVTSLTTELTTLRGTGITTALNTAVTAGQITEAERPVWEGILKADFANGSAALAKLGKSTALNTDSKLGDLGGRQESITATGSITAINDGVRAYAKEKGIDVSTSEGWDRAFREAQTAKPELFTPAAQ